MADMQPLEDHAHPVVANRSSELWVRLVFIAATVAVVEVFVTHYLLAPLALSPSLIDAYSRVGVVGVLWLIVVLLIWISVVYLSTRWLMKLMKASTSLRSVWLYVARISILGAAFALPAALGFVLGLQISLTVYWTDPAAAERMDPLLSFMVTYSHNAVLLLVICAIGLIVTSRRLRHRETE